MARKVEGGAADLVEVTTDESLVGTKYVTPVYGFPNAERGIRQGSAPGLVYVVSDAQIASGKYKLMGGSAIPVTDIATSKTGEGVGGATPVYLVGGTLAGAGGAVPDAPTNLTATQDGADVDLAWTDNATNETEYRIYRSSDGVSYSLLDTIASNLEAYTDTAPGLGTFYYYVAAVNAAGETASNADSVPLAGYTVTTTTSPQTHTITSFGVSASTTIYWGDGLSNAYTGTAQRTHDYAIAGTYTVVIGEPLNVTVLDARTQPISSNISALTSLTNVSTLNLFASPVVGDVGSLSALTSLTFLHLGSTSVSGDIASLSALISLSTLRVYSTSVSGDIADLAALTSLSTLHLNSTSVVYTGGLSGMLDMINFQAHNCGWTQAMVDDCLYDLYQAAIVPRTGTGGLINVAGTNAAPSGTFQAAASCPVTSGTPGKEVAYELLNDSCLEGFNKWATVTITA